jgi:hypothetical protein
MKLLKIKSGILFGWLCLAGILAMAQDVRITEFMANNHATLADKDGDYSDWIELYNAGTIDANLDGWYLTDTTSLLSKWKFPPTVMPANSFLIVFASGKDLAVSGSELHTNFKLASDGGFLGLIKPDGRTIASSFYPQYPKQYRDISYGIGQDVVTNVILKTGASAKIFVPTNSNLGVNWTQSVFDDSKWSAGGTGIGYETATPGFAVRNIKANISVGGLADAEAIISNPSLESIVYSENAPVINYANTGSGDNYGGNVTYPGFRMGVEIDDFVVEATATITIPTPGVYTFGVNSDDGFSLTIGALAMSFPGMRGSADTLASFNFTNSGSYPLRLVAFQGNGGAEVELFSAKGKYAAWDKTNFTLVGDVAAGGLAVSAPVIGAGSATGYHPQMKTDVQKMMFGKNASIYVRTPFVVTNVEDVSSLTLRMKYDDGFIAYLNGQEVARRNAPAVAQWKSTATNTHGLPDSLVFEEVLLTNRSSLLKAGTNILAIQGLNISTNDTAFFICPELVDYKVINVTNHYFSMPSPGRANTSGFYAYVPDTKFSVDRGFYDVPFSVAITCEMTNAVIRYTTNGTMPALDNGYVYSAPLRISSTTVLRAAAFAQWFEPSKADTHTYVFLADVIRQSPNGQTPVGWPSSWGANVVDYGMDPNVVNSPLYSGTIKNDLKSIPSFSIVLNLPDLFDPSTGIYANADQHGNDWERPASVELIYPDGTKGFQIDAGIRIRGGYSRSSSNPKHGFRLFFRQEYGANRLVYPFFGKDGTDTFEGFDLRTAQNYSWSYEGSPYGIFIRDQFCRDTQLAMDEPSSRGKFYHLYINGEYWGLYDIDERPEASFGETYLGGGKDNYDVIKVETGPYTIYATDGNMDAWTRMYNACTNTAALTNNAAYFKLQGRNPDGTINPAYENLIDATNLVDYMLLILYSGNFDAPVSAFLNEIRPNNFYALRENTGASGGFKFVSHDSEHVFMDKWWGTVPTNALYVDRNGPFPAGDDSVLYSNPQWFYQRLLTNAEFRVLVGDRAQKQFLNGGPLSPAACTARFMARKTEIDRAIVGESARWGDAQRPGNPLTRDNEWLTTINDLLNNYLPYRSDVILDQLRARSLFPSVSAPVLSQQGSNVQTGFSLVMSGFGGTVYYTTDGSDPRLIGGGISPSARIYRGPLTIEQNTTLNSRVWNGLEWSPLNEAEFTVIQTFTELLPTEIMYHPSSHGLVDADEFEFVELKNTSTNVLDLSGVHFTSGIDFTFTNGTVVNPGQFVVLVSNPDAFASNYPGVHWDGVYTKHLANDSDKLTLVHAVGTKIFSVAYHSGAPWPATADGLGYSLVPLAMDAGTDWDNPANWRASTEFGGSPGMDDPPQKTLPVVINELLTNSDPPQTDAIELYNPNESAVNIGNWYLTDTRKTPAKFKIPANTMLAPGAFKVFTEKDFNPIPGKDPSFSLSSRGEEAYLFAADSAGRLTGYCDGVEFGAAAAGVTFGRYTNRAGWVYFPAQVTNTLGAINSEPRVGPVVLNEIYYHPLPGQPDFVELKNITSETVFLYDPANPTNTWKLSGAGFEFPTGVELPAGGLALIVEGSPAVFRASNNVPADVAIYGPMSGGLQNGGELLELQRPAPPEPDTNGTVFVPYVAVDTVHYNDRSPWPTEADGQGASLERLAPSGFGDDPFNWRASEGAPTPGISVNHAPEVSAGGNATLYVLSLPVTLTISGTAVDDGLPNPPGKMEYEWNLVGGPNQVAISAPTELSTFVTFTSFGSYTLQLSASDGERAATHEATYTIQEETFTDWQQRFFSAVELANPEISGPGADPDQDGANNDQEYRSGTNPQNADSVLWIGLKSATKDATMLHFVAAAGRTFSVLYCDGLKTNSWFKIADIQAGTRERGVDVADPGPRVGAQRYYRLVTPMQP